MDIRSIPKAELHVHIEGTIAPGLARRLAERNGIGLPASIADAGDRYHWDGFDRFLEGYDLVAGCLATGRDFDDMVYDYLRRSAEQNVLYVEFFGSQDFGEKAGLAYPDMVGHMADAIDRAERDFGIVCRMVMTCIRHLGPERAVEVARTAAGNPHPHVVGFGMGGDEKAHHPSDFAPAFEIARDAGLACTVHAGEVEGSGSVAAALDHLPVSRIGHGVRSIEDPALVERLAEGGVALEICPGSNIALGLFTPEDHPFDRLRGQGCRVSLNSDDPPHFGTTMEAEYGTAARLWGYGEADLLGITRSAVEAGFADSGTKAGLLARL